MNPEFLSSALTGVMNHLWQSSLFAAVAGLLTLLLRRNRARTRYWIWLAASVKFLIPFSLLVEAGGHLGWREASVAQSNQSFAIEQIFAAPVAAIAAPVAVPRAPGTLPTLSLDAGR